MLVSHANDKKGTPPKGKVRSSSRRHQVCGGSAPHGPLWPTLPTRSSTVTPGHLTAIYNRQETPLFLPLTGRGCAPASLTVPSKQPPSPRGGPRHAQMAACVRVMLERASRREFCSPAYSTCTLCPHQSVSPCIRCLPPWASACLAPNEGYSLHLTSLHRAAEGRARSQWRRHFEKLQVPHGAQRPQHTKHLGSKLTTWGTRWPPLPRIPSLSWDTRLSAGQRKAGRASGP